MKTDEVVIRRARVGESDAVADLLMAVRRQNLATIPPMAHPPHEVRAWMAEVVFAQDEVWVAEEAAHPGVLVAVLVLGRPDWIEQLYVDAAHTDRGIGNRLVALAKSELGGSVQLWTFRSNLGARRFYERQGFEAVETTEGDNEEQAPDIRYVSTAG